MRLRAIFEGTAESTGEAFFQSLVEHLATAIQVQYAFVAEFAQAHTRVRTLGLLDQGPHRREHRIQPGRHALRGGDCRPAMCHHPAGVQERFPQDEGLIDLGIQSYLGVPLVDSEGQVLGHLAVFDERPMPPQPKKLLIFRIFASRAAAELNRLRMEQMLKESEKRYRDLFDEAPIPYVFEDTETRFVRANRAAMKLLGLRAEDVPGTVGLSLVAPTPDNQERLRAAFQDIRHGKESELVELELRRKDDGRPVWVQFWSPSEPDGKHTRTMIIDITDRVLAEREKARLQQQNQYLQEEIKSSRNFEEIVGRRPALAAVLENVRRVAPTDAIRADQRRDGHGQRTDRPGHSFHQQAARQAADQGQLRGTAGWPGGKRVVRP